MEVTFIVESHLQESHDLALTDWSPWMVQAGKSFYLVLSITSDDGTRPSADTAVLVAVHFCAWRHDETDTSVAGLSGFGSTTLAIGDRWSDAIDLMLPMNELTTACEIQLTAPDRGGHMRAVLNVHFYLAETGSLIGHLAKAITIIDPAISDRELQNAAVYWPDELTEDDLRKGIGWLVLLTEPLPHPSLVIYATSRGDYLALAASVFTPNDAGNGTLRLHDLGRMRDPESLGGVDGYGTGFSLSGYLNGDGPKVFPGPSEWSCAVALNAANGLHANLPVVCQTFVIEHFGRLPADPKQPAPTVLISTDDLLFPWELVRVSDANDVSARTLGQVAAVSRWLHHKPLPGHVRVDRSACIAPVSSTISTGEQRDRDDLASDEATAVQQFVGIEGTRFDRITPSTIPAVVKALDSTDYQLLHMRSHGTRYGVQLAAAGGTYEHAVFSLRPMHLPGWDAERETCRPFIFINVCGGTFLESELWLESLHDYGVGAAVVTLWNVASDLSRFAAEQVYCALAAGASVAEAVRTVRGAHTFDGKPGTGKPDAWFISCPPTMSRNPTPLSYIVLGHPCARVIPN